MPRRASPTRKASSSAPRATAPIVALARNRQAKAGAKGAYGVALAASLVIHAGVALGCLFWGTATDATPMPSAILVDILTPPTVTRTIEVKPAARVVAPSTRPRSKTRLSAEVKMPPPGRIEVEHLAAAPQAPPAVVVAESSAGAWPVATGTATGSPAGTISVVPATAPAVPSVVAAGATDTGAVGEIVRRLRSAAASCYPYAAIRSNIEGTTRLRFCIGDKGEPRAVEVINSSGSALLDSAAVDCVLPSAMPFPAISRPCVTVPVRFELQR
jgi:protein TonB